MAETTSAPNDQRPQTVRITPDSETVNKQLGLLAELAGTWKGEGFNLIGRPDAQGNSNVYLQLNQTRETLTITPIGSAIPNRGFGQNDIELFGLTYLQKISDTFTGGALHIEPGIWVTQPCTTYPIENAPAGGQIVGRMGSIPHGNALLAQGVVVPFTGAPTLALGSVPYAFSSFPSFNSTPIPASAPGAAIAINAIGSDEKTTAAANGVPPFTPYDLTILESATNPRTPFNTNPPDPALPNDIHGVPMQAVINDPIKLLQQVILDQVNTGHKFEGSVINIATQAQIGFFNSPNSKTGDASTTVNVINGAGGIENMLFLEGGEPTGAKGPNAQTALVYATFWIEKVTHPNREQHFMQLQYAQMVMLNFPVFKGLPNVVNKGWPHISIATLRKSFD